MSDADGSYQQLFEHTPIALFEEDRTRQFREFERLRAQGVTDFQAYFDDNPHEVWRLAKAIDIVNTNQHTVQFFEASSKQEVLSSIDQLFTPETVEVFKRGMVETANGAPGYKAEAQVRTLTGRPIYVLLHVTILHAPDGRVRALLSMLDISDRKRAEQQLLHSHTELQRSNQDLARSNSELERFAYVASHDLQEPLRMVTSYAQLLQTRHGQALDAQGEKYLGQVLEGGKRMQQLISDLLQISRLGQFGTQLGPADCEQVLDQVLDNLAVAIDEAGAEITRAPMPTVLGDPTQLSQLLQNLIGNGIKFRRDEPPRVHVSARREGPEWMFSVADNGIGIAEQDRDSVFQIFKRLHTRDEYPGTGIGLAMCHKIVERHRGRIWLDSELGRGTTFHFTLPAAPDPA